MKTRESLLNLKARQVPARRNRTGPHTRVDRDRSRRSLPRAVNIAIGEAITAARLKAGLTQAKLAVQVPGFYESQAIYHLERGATVPNLVQLRALARALKTTIHDLIPERSHGAR